MLIGAHVSSAGGIKNSFQNAINIGAKAFQIFLSPPQRYIFKEYSTGEIEEFLVFKERYKEQIKKIYAHAIYLINLASEKENIIESSVSNLIKTLNTSALLGFNGVVVHLGSAKISMEEGIKKVINNLKRILTETSENSFLYLENSAGAGNLIGGKIEHLKEILESIQSNRIKICIDTQHSFASGYDIVNKCDEFIDKLISYFGDQFDLIHLNDSKTEFNSHKDRHENIGRGKIGITAFEKILNNKCLKNHSFILEVPGFDNQGPDAENIRIVNSLIK